MGLSDRSNHNTDQIVKNIAPRKCVRICPFIQKSSVNKGKILSSSVTLLVCCVTYTIQYNMCVHTVREAPSQSLKSESKRTEKSKHSSAFLHHPLPSHSLHKDAEKSSLFCGLGLKNRLSGK